MIANMLGLGWAATPAGLQAMEELEGLEEERRREGKKFVPQGLQTMKCVHFDYQHIIAAAYSNQHDCLQDPVWQYQSHCKLLVLLWWRQPSARSLAAIYCKWKTESGADGSAF